MFHSNYTGMLRLFYLLLIIFSASCKIIYQPTSLKYKDYRLTSSSAKDDQIHNLIASYSDSVNKSMNDIIVVSEKSLEKKQPEGTLGNMMADAMLLEAKKHFNTNVDAAFINYGGIRLTSLAAGTITRGKIFELSPFDNIIVLLKVNGELLKQFATHISGRGGWPVAGISWKISDTKATEIKLNNIPLDESKEYTIAMVDYVANGGDDCVFLKNITQQNDGFIYRDALINYLSEIHQSGKKISYNIEKRISNAN